MTVEQRIINYNDETEIQIFSEQWVDDFKSNTPECPITYYGISEKKDEPPSKNLFSSLVVFTEVTSGSKNYTINFDYERMFDTLPKSQVIYIVAATNSFRYGY